MEFQSALPRGERLHYHPLSKDYHDFNPRSREGSDQISGRHSLTRSRFQSALPRGERRVLAQVVTAEMIFQSALPRGERLRKWCIFRCMIYFNPRSREGSDKRRFNDNLLYHISIRAPARGATSSRLHPCHKKRISIRAPARGATTHRNNSAFSTFYFNPRSREGSDINFHQKVFFFLSKNCLIHLFFITNFLI